MILLLFSCSKSSHPEQTFKDTKIIDFAKKTNQDKLIKGWKALEWTSGKTLVWSDGPLSELTFSSRISETKLALFRCMPVHYPATPPQIIRVSVNDDRVADIPLTSEWNDYQFVMPKRTVREGKNRLKFEYGYGQTVKTTISSRVHPPIAFVYLKIDSLVETSMVDFGNPHDQSDLIDGWYPDEKSNELTYVWSKGGHSRVRFDVSEISNKELQVRCMPFPDQEDAGQKIRIAVNGEDVSELQISGAWNEYSVVIPASSLRLGHNTLGFSYSHPKLEEHGFRILAIAVDYIRMKSIPLTSKTGTKPAEVHPDSPSKSRSDRPLNFIVYVLDALRADHLSTYGYGRKTSPEIDRIAVSGIVFDNAFSQAPYTLASVSSYFTSTYPLFIKGGQALHTNSTTMAEVMRANGYQTAAISANIFISKAYGTMQGFDRIHEISVDPRMNDSTAKITAVLPSILTELTEIERPFFLYVHSLNPHSPYKVPEPFWSRFRQPDVDPVQSSNEFLLKILYGETKVSPVEKHDMVAQYDGGILFSDSEIGKTVQLLKDRNLLDSTVLIITADHGEEFLDHGSVLHGGQLFDESIHVPLIFSNPRIFNTPERISTPVELIDLMPTILELTGSPASSSVRMQGTSLLQHLSTTRKPELVTYAYEPDLKALSIRNSRWKFIHAPEGMGYGAARKAQTAWLFDLPRDPNELQNQAAAQPALVESFRERALIWIARQKEKLSQLGPTAAKGPDLDAADKERLRALGYIQ